jgi:hypothetical protein
MPRPDIPIAVESESILVNEYPEAVTHLKSRNQSAVSGFFVVARGTSQRILLVTVESISVSEDSEGVCHLVDPPEILKAKEPT